MTKRLTPFGILSLILLAAVLLNVSIGSSGMPLSTLFDVLGAALHGTAAASDPNGVYATILFQLRLPHMVLMLLVGAALAGSGAAYQGLFRNPLADPYLIGVASGAGLGAVAAMSVHWPYNAVGWMAVPLSAFIGAVLAVAMVAMMARVGKTIPTTQPDSGRGGRQFLLLGPFFTADDQCQRGTCAVRWSGCWGEPPRPAGHRCWPSCLISFPAC